MKVKCTMCEAINDIKEDKRKISTSVKNSEYIQECKQCGNNIYVSIIVN